MSKCNCSKWVLCNSCIRDDAGLEADILKLRAMLEKGGGK